MAAKGNANTLVLLSFCLMLVFAGCTTVSKEPGQLVPGNATSYVLIKPKAITQDPNLSAQLGLDQGVFSNSELAKYGIELMKVESIIVFSGPDPGYRAAIMKGGFESASVLKYASNKSFGNYTIEDYEGSPLIQLRDRNVTLAAVAGNLVMGPEEVVRDVILTSAGKSPVFGTSFTNRALAKANGATLPLALAVSSEPHSLAAKAAALGVFQTDSGIETRMALVFATSAEAEVRRKDMETALDFLRASGNFDDAERAKKVSLGQEEEALVITIGAKDFQETSEILKMLSLG